MEEKVKDYINTIKKKMIKWIIVELITEAFEIAAFVIILLKATNNPEDLSYLVFILMGMFAILFGTIFISIKVNFGSLKNFSEIFSIQNKYNLASENLKNAEKNFDKGKIFVDELNKAKNDYDNMISEIANKIWMIKKISLQESQTD